MGRAARVNDESLLTEVIYSFLYRHAPDPRNLLASLSLSLLLCVIYVLSFKHGDDVCNKYTGERRHGMRAQG